MSVELNDLFPEGRRVEVRQRGSKEADVFIIRPFTIGQLPRVLGAIRALLEAGSVDAEGNVNLLDAFTFGAEYAIDLVGIATGMPREYFDNLDLDQGVELLAAVVEVNADFFKQRVQPRLTEKLKGIGLTR